MSDIGKLARDTGYTVLGLVLIRVQQAQVRRREIEREVNSRLEAVGRTLPEPVRGLVARPR
ncbi:MAG TPA: hypothetical protein VFA11_07330 [Acidimicrobiales bacterium]|nr:hypothetical protein [Acidimicrobiales bacterium]